MIRPVFTKILNLFCVVKYALHIIYSYIHIYIDTHIHWLVAKCYPGVLHNDECAVMHYLRCHLGAVNNMAW